MAKRAQAAGSKSRTAIGRTGARSQKTQNATTEQTKTRDVDRKIVHYAEELGRIVGTVRGRADAWTGDRERLIKRLSTVVGEAQNLLSNLGHQAQHQVKRLASARIGMAHDGAAKTRRKSGKIRNVPRAKKA